MSPEGVAKIERGHIYMKMFANHHSPLCRPPGSTASLQHPVADATGRDIPPSGLQNGRIRIT
jgi:hypothetical protein